ncbi:MAG TPA: hypothetical protein VHY32_03400 [Caulobacteraceae bacterium]|nr:hypothetical protein [Caulobacteraceae bacterium]
MASEIPRFRGSGDDDEARWEAYRELLRRSAPEPAKPDPAEAEADPLVGKDERRGFGPLTVEDAERAFADAEPDSLWSTETLRLEIPEEHRPRSTRSRRTSSGRNTRLTVIILALTAGIILAAALVPHHPHEPAVIAWTHGQSAQSQSARPRSAQPAAAPAPPAPAPAQTITSAPLPRPAQAPATPVAAPTPPAMALNAVETPADTQTVRHRVHRVLRGEAAARPCTDCDTAVQRPSARDRALSCWLTQMNNGDVAGSPDAGLTICKGAPLPTKYLGQD